MSYKLLGGNKMFNQKWNELFNSEKELVEALVKIDIDLYKSRYCKGYEFIDGFIKRIKGGKELTEKQIIQLKRLSNEIYKYHNW
jgi:hypothetical protein